MAKKKSPKHDRYEEESIGTIADMLSDLMANNGISPLDLLEAMEHMKTHGIDDIYQQMYHYQKPDYTQIAQPLHPALHDLLNMEGVEGVTDNVSKALKAMLEEGPAAASKALVNAIYSILANQEELMEGERTNLQLFGILHIMIAMGVKDATPAILELLRQDGHFYEFFFSAFEEEMSFAISVLCKQDLKDLEDFMHQSGLIPQTQYIVADGVIHMALTDQAMRDDVIAWMERMLTRYAQTDVFELNIDHITKSLSQLRAPQLTPLILHLYKVNKIPFIEIASMKDVMSLLKNGTDDRRIVVESLLDIISRVENNYLDSLDDDDDDDDDWDDDWDEEIDNTSLLVDENYDGLLYRLEITLDDCTVPVSRELVVPSNIRLSWLGKVLMAAMGWDGSHLDQFIKGKEYYGYLSDDFEPWSDDVLDYSEFALNDILSRKGTKIRWEYDFGDSWEHTIRLAEKIKDGGEEVYEVTKAENACPPDDCGGVWGYANMLEALKDKSHPEHETWKDWIGPRFNPLKVSLKKLNTSLKSVIKQAR